MPAPAIMAYVGSDANVVGLTGVVLPPYFINNQVYGMAQGASATDGFRQFTALPSGDETLARTRLQVGSTVNVSTPVTISYDGYLLYCNGFGSNSRTLAALRVDDLTLASTFGISSGSLSQSDGTRILSPNNFAPVMWGDLTGSFSSYVVSCAFVTTPGEVCILTMPTLVAPNLVNNFVAHVDEARAICGPGEVTSSFGTSYVVGKKPFGAPHTSTPLGLYVLRVSALPITFTKVGTVSPAQVDATWTDFLDVNGVALDQTDGNPIIQVYTDNVVTNKVYFVKLNKTNAAVIWACPVNFQNIEADEDISKNVIVNQRLYYLGSGNVLYTINTATGVATTEVVTGLACMGGQISEDISNSLIGYGQWFESTVHPTYVGTYMGTLGNHTLVNKWWRYFPGGLPVPQFSAGRKWLAESGPVRI